MSDTLRVSNLHFGNAASNYNQPQMGFTSVGIGSTANYGFLQFFGTSNTLCWTANGTVGIGTTAPSGRFVIYGTSADSTSPPDSSPNNHHLIITNSKTGTTPYAMALGMDQTYGVGYINAAGNGMFQPVCLQTRGGNVGVGTTNPSQTLDVYGTIARSSLKLPRVDYATFTTATTVSVPILFNDSQYNMVEIRIRYFPTAETSMTISATSTAPATMTITEAQYSYIQYAQTAFTYSYGSGVTTMPFATNVETQGIDNNALIRITRATGTSSTGIRNHYTIDNVYCWFTVGTTRATSMGHFDSPSVGGPSLAFFNITCTTSGAQFSGSYSTTHYN